MSTPPVFGVSTFRRGPGLVTMLINNPAAKDEDESFDPDDPAGDGRQTPIPRRGRILSATFHMEPGGADSMKPTIYLDKGGERFMVHAFATAYQDRTLDTPPPDELPAPGLEGVIYYDWLDGEVVFNPMTNGGTPTVVKGVWLFAEGWGTEREAAIQVETIRGTRPKVVPPGTKA